MATTNQLITWIELQSHGWQREGKKGIRALFNEAHKLLPYDEIEQRLVIDATIGDFPFLATQDGVFQYVLPANCSILKKLVIDYDETKDEYPWSYEDFQYKGKLYYRILNITCREATNNVGATISFVGVNPGATTSKFRLIYFETPINITSDSVQHQMPGSTDFDYLVPATIKLIEGIDHGNIIEARQYINEVIKKEFRRDSDRGEQGVPLYCRKRRF